MSGTCVIHGTKAVISSGLPLNTAVACQGECLDSDPVNLPVCPKYHYFFEKELCLYKSGKIDVFKFLS